MRWLFILRFCRQKRRSEDCEAEKDENYCDLIHPVLLSWSTHPLHPSSSPLFQPRLAMVVWAMEAIDQPLWNLELD